MAFGGKDKIQNLPWKQWLVPQTWDKAPLEWRISLLDLLFSRVDTRVALPGNFLELAFSCGKLHTLYGNFIAGHQQTLKIPYVLKLLMSLPLLPQAADEEGTVWPPHSSGHPGTVGQSWSENSNTAFKEVPLPPSKFFVFLGPWVALQFLSKSCCCYICSAILAKEDLYTWKKEFFI